MAVNPAYLRSIRAHYECKAQASLTDEELTRLAAADTFKAADHRSDISCKAPCTPAMTMVDGPDSFEIADHKTANGNKIIHRTDTYTTSFFWSSAGESPELIQKRADEAFKELDRDIKLMERGNSR